MKRKSNIDKSLNERTIKNILESRLEHEFRVPFYAYFLSILSVFILGVLVFIILLGIFEAFKTYPLETLTFLFPILIIFLISVIAYNRRIFG